MRKLRRLPWRIPKPHHSQPNAAAPDNCPRIEEEREARRERERELLRTQPVAFAAGRYVYDVTSSLVPRSTEVRRKARHRTVEPYIPAS